MRPPGAALAARSFIGRSDDYRIDDPARNVQTLEIDGVTSFRWVEYSLFRELTLTWVLPDVVIELTDAPASLLSRSFWPSPTASNRWTTNPPGPNAFALPR